MFLILETTVLDEVQLDVPLDDVPDVPQLPVLLDVQNAAIILEDVPDVQTILENNAGPVVKAWRTFQFISPIITYMRGGSQQVVVRMHHVSRVRGLETQLVWAISKETARLSPEGIPYCATKVQSITWIQCVAGRVTHYASHLRHEISVDVTLGCYQPLPYHQESGGHRPEARLPAPGLHYPAWFHPEQEPSVCGGKGPPGRPCSGQPHGRGKFIRTYNDFVDYLSDPSKRNDIDRELAEAKIHHVNMIDVLFELVLFGMMTAQKSLMVHPGGFVERLYALLYSFLPTAANMEPEADRYLLLLNDYCDTLPPNRDLDTNALHYFALNLTF
ncbi:uncharacterized protein LOC116366319 [Oncorhynchus kisutch]|uniref:uncharacterized protein LOC116366319 n=1 Tax=Oncorhynchus kisutch TaxID=8019 RepID=UPI0012DD53A4|nr:uncharacterized protein LOC116366319 [Oncorhynchus kisutch]